MTDYSKLDIAEIRKRSPLYDGLEDDAAKLLFILIDSLARKIETPEVTPDERVITTEKLIHLGYVQIVEHDEGFSLQLTNKGFMEINPAREIMPFLSGLTEGEA